MPKKSGNIPINTMADHFDAGIAIERLSIDPLEEANLNASDEAKKSHREDRHSFFLLERGTVILEIDDQHNEAADKIDRGNAGLRWRNGHFLWWGKGRGNHEGKIYNYLQYNATVKKV